MGRFDPPLLNLRYECYIVLYNAYAIQLLLIPWRCLWRHAVAIRIRDRSMVLFFETYTYLVFYICLCSSTVKSSFLKIFDCILIHHQILFLKIDPSLILVNSPDLHLYLQSSDFRRSSSTLCLFLFWAESFISK